MQFFELITPASFVILTILCLIITVLCLKKIMQFKIVGGVVIVLLTIILIDALKTLFESVYFGLYFSSLYGVIPSYIGQVLEKPSLVIIPKLINVIAGLLVTYLLIKHWEPRQIQEIKQAEEKQKLAANVFSSSNQGIVITDIKGIIIDINDAFIEITGYSRDELIGKNPRILKSGRQSPEFYTEMWTSLMEKGLWKGEIWNKHKNGEIYAEMLTISTVSDSFDKVQNYVALFTDITMLKEHQRQLEYHAYYDALTNLPNRNFFAKRLTQSMVQCQQNSRSLAVFFLDLDSFKSINDSYGHQVGDQLLITISRRMKEVLRNVDMLARIGGDEFVAVIENVNNIEDGELVLKRLLKAASEPIAFMGGELQITVSIGATIYPHDGSDADQLMRHADQAMYIAKQKGKNRYQFFDTVKDIEQKAQHKCIRRISTALKQREFVLSYQPKVNLRTGVVIGVEALIRWQHPENGLLPPSEFLPSIENHAISIEVGEWVIDSALNQMSEWQAIGLELPISVNISAFQLQQDNFSTRLSILLAAHQEVTPDSLQLEVLETSALVDLINVSAIMHACGVSFAIDDFGTGYSSLAYLRHLPANLIKIDQSFVRDMLTNPDDLAIVESVVSLANSFKRGVIAEGVESIAHGTALLKIGCELAQGYAIARPMEAKYIPDWVANWLPDKEWQECFFSDQDPIVLAEKLSYAVNC
jgi:diguanylate cyclase (GGDEF)-like protein/PAS domain S-box-containing protein